MDLLTLDWTTQRELELGVQMRPRETPQCPVCSYRSADCSCWQIDWLNQCALIFHSIFWNRIKPQACLTSNTRLIRVVSCTPYIQPTNRNLIRVTFGPFDCIRESRVQSLKKSWNGCHGRVWSYNWSYKTVSDRVRPYETIYTTVNGVHYTSELNSKCLNFLTTFKL